MLIQRNSQNADNGKFHLKDLSLKTIATTIKTQDLLPETCKTRDLFLSKKKMLTNIETSRSFFSIEPTVTGKLKLFFPHTLSWITDLKVSQMVYHPAVSAWEINATLAINLWSSPRPLMPTPAVMIAKWMDPGLKESTLESTEINKSSTPWEDGWDSLQNQIQQSLVLVDTVPLRANSSNEPIII